jgi:hypothetical protein
LSASPSAWFSQCVFTAPDHGKNGIQWAGKRPSSPKLGANRLDEPAKTGVGSFGPNHHQTPLLNSGSVCARINSAPEVFPAPDQLKINIALFLSGNFAIHFHTSANEKPCVILPEVWAQNLVFLALSDQLKLNFPR